VYLTLDFLAKSSCDKPCFFGIFFMFSPMFKINKENKIKKSPLLAKIKFESTFFQVLWRFAFLLPFFGEAGTGTETTISSFSLAKNSKKLFAYFFLIIP